MSLASIVLRDRAIPCPRRFEGRNADRVERKRKLKGADEGFALIDVLVSLALVGVISSLMIVFLGQARTMVRIGKSTQMQMEVDAAVRFLESTIAGAELLPLPQSPPDHAVYLNGTSTELQFSAIQAIGFGANALREISIAPRDGDVDQQENLFITQKPRRGASGAAESHAVMLISDVIGIRFEYLDGSSGAWSADWNLERRLPVAIHFKVSVKRDGASYSSDGLARLGLANQRSTH